MRFAPISHVGRKKPTIRERATAAVNAYRVARLVQSGGGNRYADAALRYEIDGLPRMHADQKKKNRD